MIITNNIHSLFFTNTCCVVFFSTEFDQCQANVCLNGGTCENIQGVNSFRCTCAIGFTGSLCETGELRLGLGLGLGLRLKLKLRLRS